MSRTVRVSNIAAEMSSDHLLEIMTVAGPVYSLNVHTPSLGYAKCVYTSNASAQRAVTYLHGFRGLSMGFFGDAIPTTTTMAPLLPQRGIKKLLRDMDAEVAGIREELAQINVAKRRVDAMHDMVHALLGVEERPAVDA